MNFKSFYEDKLPGGKGDFKDVTDFDPISVTIGMTVESEHTKDKEVQKEICLDHLTEDKYYYQKILLYVEPNEIKSILKKAKLKSDDFIEWISVMKKVK